jgi:hypothetical protein
MADASDEDVANPDVDSSTSPDVPAELPDEETPGPEPGAEAGDDDEADDDDVSELLPQELTEHPSVKAMSKRLKKLNRQNRRLRDESGRFRGLNVDELAHKARVHDELQQLLQRRPDLARALLEGSAAVAAPSEPSFNPDDLPFDTSDASGKFFAKFYQDFMALQRDNKELRQHLTNVTEQTSRETRRGVAVRWKQAVDAAADQLPDAYRDMFSDAMYLAFKESQEKGVNLDPQAVIGHYLKRHAHTKQTIQRATQAAQQRMAQGNQATPRGMAPQGTPASARNPKELLADVHKRLKARLAGP